MYVLFAYFSPKKENTTIHFLAKPAVWKSAEEKTIKTMFLVTCKTSCEHVTQSLLFTLFTVFSIRTGN
jgi:hypothetical protein